MHSTLYLLFLVAALVAVFTPGPAVMLAIQNSTLYGWRRTLLSSLGNITGLLILINASSVGLGAVLRASATLFLLLKIAGGAYLIWLGIKQWRAGRPKWPQIAKQTSAPSQPALFREGLLLALSNPKAILFITALFPQFIVRDAPLPGQLLLLSATFMTLSFGALTCYAVACKLMARKMQSVPHSGRFRRITGSLFMLMGIGLLALKTN